MSAAASRVVLEAVGLSRSFGGVSGASDVCFEVRRGQVVGLIGPNGAGKSTVLNCMSGVDKPTSGTVLLRGVDVTSLPVQERIRRGMGRTFQLQRLFPTLTVLENVRLPLESTALTRLVGGPRSTRGSATDAGTRATESLERVGLASLAPARVDSLTAGQMRLVEMARLIAMEAEALLLDEPAAGLNYGEGEELFALIHDLADEGRAVLLVEHRIRSVVQIVDHLVVMDHGVVIAEGAPQDVMALAQVREAYMGPDADARTH